MIELSALFGTYVVGSIALIAYVLKENRLERERLEDRLMALSQPDALTLHKALSDPEPGTVSYMDEEAEYALGNGNVDLLGDD